MTARNEMLMWSHSGVIHMLPTMPKEWRRLSHRNREAILK